MDASLIFGALLGAAMIGFLLLIRLKDLPAPAPLSPFQHLDERKASIYENLRDLNFEYKAGKIPDADFASLKSSLQDEAATLLAEIARLEKNPAPQKGPRS